MVKTITTLHQLSSVSLFTITENTRQVIEDQFPRDQGYNALTEDVLDDMGHFVRSAHFLLNEAASPEKIAETFIRLRYLTEIFDTQTEENVPLLKDLLKLADESVQCAIFFLLASVEKNTSDSSCLMNVLDALTRGKVNSQLASKALMIAQHPNLEDHLILRMKSANARVSAIIHKILRFRQKHNRFIKQF